MCAASFAQNAGSDRGDAAGLGFDSEALLGAKVQGPGTNAFGYVTGFVRDIRSGELTMYVVETYGWFNGEGVIPVTSLVDIHSRQGKEEVEHRLEVKVNQATFRNIAKWDGEGPVSSYLKDYKSILSTVYGLDPEQLGADVNYYELDAKKRAGDGSATSVTMAE